VSHPRAALTPNGRLILVHRMAQGRPAAHVAAEMGISRATAYKWWLRFVVEGVAGLADRSSRPLRSPRRTSARLERRIEELRRASKLGPPGWPGIGSRTPNPSDVAFTVRKCYTAIGWKSPPVCGRQNAMGLGVGILLIAVGAILAFAVNVDTSATGVNLHTIGIILLVVGVLGTVLSMFFWSSWGGFSRRRTTVAPGGTTTTTIDQP
jgi:leucine-zipper of insertion element IS481/Domain of unknown function (DUF6458)